MAPQAIKYKVMRYKSNAFANLFAAIFISHFFAFPFGKHIYHKSEFVTINNLFYWDKLLYRKSTI